MPVNPNDESFLLQTLSSIHGAIEKLDTKIDHTQASISEVKGEQIAQGMTLQQVLKQVAKTNGTVLDHDGRIDHLEARNDRADGRAEGRRDALRLATKPATWVYGGVIAAVGYIIERKAG